MALTLSDYMAADYGITPTTTQPAPSTTTGAVTTQYTNPSAPGYRDPRFLMGDELAAYQANGTVPTPTTQPAPSTATGTVTTQYTDPNAPGYTDPRFLLGDAAAAYQANGTVPAPVTGTVPTSTTTTAPASSTQPVSPVGNYSTTSFNAVPLAAPTQVAPVTVTQGSLTTPVAATTESQLGGILNRGGVLMQQAETAGNQQAAARGLLNSSMGIQAAQAAVLDRAIPIATNDASSLNQMATYNAGTLNQNLATTAQTQNQVAQFNAQNLNQAAQFDAQNLNAAAQWNAGQLNEASLKAMDIDNRTQLAGIEANYKTMMQTNASAEGIYTQAMNNITDIQQSDTISDKKTAIDSQLAWLTSGMQMLENLNGITGLVSFNLPQAPENEPTPAP